MTKVGQSRSRCAIANSLGILGDRWSLLIIRDLMFTNRREFGHFLQAGEGISTNILSQRLNHLVETNIITKQAHPEHGKKFIYQLTERGVRLAPVLIELAAWGYTEGEGEIMSPELLDMATNHRAKLMRMIKARQPIVVLPLS